MRRVILAAAAVLLLGGCSVAVPGSAAPAAAGSAACTPSTPTSGFTDAEKRFGITPPSGWTTDTSRQYGSDATFLAPAAPRSGRAKSGSFTSSVNVRVVATPVDMQQAIAGVRQELKVRNLQVLTVAGGSAVIATGTALQDDWSTYAQPIDAAVRSLTVPS